MADTGGVGGQEATQPAPKPPSGLAHRQTVLSSALQCGARVPSPQFFFQTEGLSYVSFAVSRATFPPNPLAALTRRR